MDVKLALKLQKMGIVVGSRGAAWAWWQAIQRLKIRNHVKYTILQIFQFWPPFICKISAFLRDKILVSICFCIFLRPLNCGFLNLWLDELSSENVVTPSKEQILQQEIKLFSTFDM